MFEPFKKIEIQFKKNVFQFKINEIQFKSCNYEELGN